MRINTGKPLKNLIRAADGVDKGATAITAASNQGAPTA